MGTFKGKQAERAEVLCDVHGKGGIPGIDGYDYYTNAHSG